MRDFLKDRGNCYLGHSAQRLGCVWAHEGPRQIRHLPFWLKVLVQGNFSFVCEDVARFMECQTDVLCAMLLYMLVNWCTRITNDGDEELVRIVEDDAMNPADLCRCRDHQRQRHSERLRQHGFYQ